MCVYIHMCVYIYIYMYVYVYIYIYIYVKQTCFYHHFRFPTARDYNNNNNSSNNVLFVYSAYCK